jgi:hypothetical protein
LYRGETVKIEAAMNGESGLTRFGGEAVKVTDHGADLLPAIERHLWRLAAKELPPRVQSNWPEFLWPSRLFWVLQLKAGRKALPFTCSSWIHYTQSFKRKPATLFCFTVRGFAFTFRSPSPFWLLAKSTAFFTQSSSDAIFMNALLSLLLVSARGCFEFGNFKC